MRDDAWTSSLTWSTVQNSSELLNPSSTIAFVAANLSNYLYGGRSRNSWALRAGTAINRLLVALRRPGAGWHGRPTLSDLDRFSENLKLNNGRLSFWVKRWCQTTTIKVATSGIDDHAYRGNNFAYVLLAGVCAQAGRALFRPILT